MATQKAKGQSKAKTSTKSKGGKRNRKYGRHDRAPSNKTQPFRTAANKAKRIAKANQEKVVVALDTNYNSTPARVDWIAHHVNSRDRKMVKQWQRKQHGWSKAARKLRTVMEAAFAAAGVVRL